LLRHEYEVLNEEFNAYDSDNCPRHDKRHGLNREKFDEHGIRRESKGTERWHKRGSQARRRKDTLSALTDWTLNLLVRTIEFFFLI